MGKRILLGISGGIAAYKSMSLIRLFKKSGYEVKVAATKNALQFVTQLTIETLSQNKLYHDMFDLNRTLEVEHIALADWADAVVVAPATANIIGKFANGIADDALSTLLIATKKPIFIAPAMNTNMFEDISVQSNIQKLRDKGCFILSPDEGFLACGTSGKGRMMEPEDIFLKVDFCLNKTDELKGKKVLISAGPTYEQIDPVRFIGNNSSGLMGFCLAETAAKKGAEVTLVTGPTNLSTSSPNISRVDVRSAEEMFQACVENLDSKDVIIMSAAVADFTPVHTATEKIKKNDTGLTIELTKTKDILAYIGSVKRDCQTLVGFALETNNEVENAKKKLYTKNADYIVLNSLRTKGAGFQCATNKVTIFGKDGSTHSSELKSKQEIAEEIFQVITTKTNL